MDKKTGTLTTVEIPRPVTVEKYNQYMGGLDKSNQFFAYHNVTVRYWKTPFYHAIDIATVNAFILYNYIATLRVSNCYRK